MKPVSMRDKLSFRGEVRFEFSDKNGKIIRVIEDKNFIVDLGHELVVDILSGSVGSKIFRMAIGDQGTVSGQPFVPKTPDATWPARTGLFHELIRLNNGTPTQPTSKSMRFLASFQSANIDTTSFSTSPRVVNEAALIVSSGSETGRQQINKTPPDPLDPSENLFSLRTFKSQPFDPSDTLTLSVAWTIFVQ